MPDGSVVPSPSPGADVGEGKDVMGGRLDGTETGGIDEIRGGAISGNDGASVDDVATVVVIDCPSEAVG